MKTEEELQRFYDSYLKMEIEPLEEFRLKETVKAKKINVYIIISIAAFILSFFSFLLCFISLELNMKFWLK